MRISMLIYAICLPLLTITILISGCSSSTQSTTIDLIFRYDDYSATSDLDFSYKLLSVLDRYQTPVLFGIIPITEANNEYHDPAIFNNELLPINEENVLFLRRGIDSGLIDIAMHGYSHQNNNGEEASEFTNLDLQSQMERLSAGKAILEENIGHDVSIFIPPWNEYDHNTLIALEQLGFTAISARGRGVRSNEVNLSYFPFSCTLENLRNGIDQVNVEKKEHVTVIVLFHEYEFKDNSTEEGIITFKDFSRLLRWINKQQNIRIIHLSEANSPNLDLFYCP